jgi:hypothetical protein
MNKRSVIVILLLQFTFSICEAQFILAGNVSGGDTYFDIIPDSTLEALNVHISPYPGDTIVLDVDNDGIEDYEIRTYGGGGLGGGAGGCIIIPLGTYAQVASHIDTSNGCCPMQYIAQLADTLVLGDTISNTLLFLSGSTFLWSTTYGAAQAPIINDWNDIGEHYIGIRLTYPTDTLYGWIRVEATNIGHFILSVKDFACNKNPFIGINEEYDNRELIIYPNPFFNKITVSCSNCDNAIFTIYDLFSSKILELNFTKSISISTEQFADGIYFYEVKNKLGVITNGKIIKK